MHPQDDTDARRAAAAVAMGTAAADLVVRGGRVVEVHTGAIVAADVALKAGRIAAIGEVSRAVGPDTELYDADGAFLVPGFIDCHLHVGGSQLRMTELARLLVSRGTAAISTCFYEPAGIGGPEALAWVLDEIRQTPLQLLFSPFPACYLGLGPLGNPGRFGADDLLAMLAEPECVEIREWNAFMEAIPDPALDRFIAEARRRRLVIGGHLEGQTGDVLQASVALGAGSDHEVATADEAIERARLGVRVQIRQGSAAWDLEPVVRAITEHRVDPRMFMFSTDEEECHRLAALGHIDLNVRMAVAAGLAPVTAVQMATLNAAEHLRVDDRLGSIAPGRVAHINVVDDLAAMHVRDVIAGGEVVVRDGRYVAPLQAPEPPQAFRETLRLGSLPSAQDFEIAVEDAGEDVTVRVIGVREGSLLTAERLERVRPVDERIHADPQKDLVKIAALDRHHASGHLGKGLLHGTGLKRGAFAASFTPGIQNVLVVGVDDADMATCVRRLAELGGGAVAVLDGDVLAEVPLPVLGVFSEQPAEEVAAQMQAVEHAIREELGCPFVGVLTNVGFTMCAVSIPGLRIYEGGLARIRRDGSEPVSLTVPEAAGARA